MRGNLENIKGKGFDKNPQNINRAGRPKKYVLSLKKEGYKLTEINDTLEAMVAMSVEELRKVFESDKSTILEKTIAAALRNGLKKGDLGSLETLLNRVYGRPNQKMDITTQGERIDEPRYVINIVRTTTDDGDKDNKSISGITGL
jgi:hypothetical protein